MICFEKLTLTWYPPDKYWTLLSQRPGNPKSDKVTLAAGLVVVSDGGADAVFEIGPAPAATDANARIASREPSGTVRWRAIVIVVPHVLYPLAHISQHVVKAKCVWREAAYRRGVKVPVVA